jgi:hypothetical protein
MNRNTMSSFDDKDRNSLEKNHTHFLLLDDGKYCSKHSNNGTNQTPTTVTNSQLKLNQYDQQRRKGLMKINLKIVFY